MVETGSPWLAPATAETGLRGSRPRQPRQGSARLATVTAEPGSPRLAPVTAKTPWLVPAAVETTVKKISPLFRPGWSLAPTVMPQQRQYFFLGPGYPGSAEGGMAEKKLESLLFA